MNRAVFLDRDNTLIEMVGYRSALTADEVALKPGVAEGLKMLIGLGFKTVVVTNQGRLATGELTVDTLREIHVRLNDLLIFGGAPPIDVFYWCPHKNLANRGIPCACAKPNPGMIVRACNELEIDPQQSYIIGDDARDMAAGMAASIKRRFILVDQGDLPTSDSGLATLKFSSFLDAASMVRMLSK